MEYRCLSHLPRAVGKNPTHFDLSLARKRPTGVKSEDWLVLHVQELISLAYQVLDLEAILANFFLVQILVKSLKSFSFPECHR